ncbi:MAG: ATP-dependent Clp protease adaptor ClpS [Anaerolineae bacterium]|nr:ATP-dependent Clp protease adaptor ClpS [Anaerolineae bacterium]
MLSPEIWVEPEIDRETEEEQTWESLWRVIIHNDNITPYAFVIDILLRIFGLDNPKAELVTWTAHTTGIAYVTSLPKKEAERRVGKAHFAASLEGYPLTFTIEPE